MSEVCGSVVRISGEAWYSTVDRLAVIIEFGDYIIARCLDGTQEIIELFPEPNSEGEYSVAP